MQNENQETKLCKHCQTEIPKKAKVCPNCRKKQNGIAKWIVIAIVVFIIIGIFGGGSEEDDVTIENASVSVENEDVTEVEASTEEQKNNIVEVGGTFEKNGLKITVNEVVVDFTDYEDKYGWNTPKDGMKYVMASFTFENNGESDQYVSQYDFDCYADNTTCEQVYGLDDDDFINTNLSTGRNISFKAYYQVPIDCESIELEYETDIWSGEKVIIKIQ